MLARFAYHQGPGYRYMSVGHLAQGWMYRWPTLLLLLRLRFRRPQVIVRALVTGNASIDIPHGPELPLDQVAPI